MEYGKQFQQNLEDSSFPDDWTSSAIEYSRESRVARLRSMTSMHVS